MTDERKRIDPDAIPSAGDALAEALQHQAELDRLALADDVAMKARGERHDG